MAKIKRSFHCKECGYNSTKWWGVCPDCGAYDSFEERSMQPSPKHASASRSFALQGGGTHAIDEISVKDVQRIKTGIDEFDRVLGGGIVPASLVLVGGEPGIGKSTLLLQLALRVGNREKVLYVSGEESKEQIKLRSERLREKGEHLYLCSESNMELIEQIVLDHGAKFVIIDSIQTMVSDAVSGISGSVSQIKECCSRLLHLAKRNQISIFIVGHVTKEGSIAGPKVLEHIVDTVIYFEGEKFQSLRLTRSIKNRFGSTNELGVFEMTGQGLLEVTNPSMLMLNERVEGMSGSVIVASLEGNRPLLIEMQALVTASNLPVARRTATGIDYNRMNMLLAIMEKKAGFALSNQDVYVNLTGGIKKNEPSIDLAIVLSIASSYKNKEIREGTIVFGEVGLTGEVRMVTQAEKRVKEAEKLGFARILLPKLNRSQIITETKCELIGIGTIQEAIKHAFR